MIQDNNFATVYEKSIMYHIRRIFFGDDWGYNDIIEIKTRIVSIMDKYNGEFKKYDNALSHEAIYIQSKLAQRYFVDELNAYIIEVKLTGGKYL